MLYDKGVTHHPYLITQNKTKQKNNEKLLNVLRVNTSRPMSEIAGFMSRCNKKLLNV